MKEFSVYQAFVNFLVSVLVALITSMITLTVERKQKINEIQREIYMAIYKNLNLLKSNPTLIYDEEFFQDIKDLKVEVELYANNNICSLIEKLKKIIAKTLRAG